MTNKKIKNSITEGSITKAIFKIATPVVIANFLQTAYNMIDAIWLGRFSSEAVASVSLSFPILFLSLSVGAGFTIAGTILVAQFYGAGEREKVNWIASQVILYLLFFSILISVIGSFVAGPVIKLSGAKGVVAQGAVSYLKIIFSGLIFVFSFFVFQSLLRGIGVVWFPMYVVLGTVILNFIIDPIFIFGWGKIPTLGVSGAAIATIISQGIASLVLAFVFVKGNFGIKISAKFMKPDFSFFKKVFLLGFPSALEHSVRTFSFALIVFLVGRFGVEVVASYGIATRIFGILIIPTVGLAIATTTLVGQNMGAGRVKRAEKISIITSVVAFFLLTFLGLIFRIFSVSLVKIFIPHDIKVIEVGAQFLRIVTWTFGFIGIQIVLGGTFRGSGNTKTALLISIFTFILMRVSLCYFLSFHTPLKERGIFLAFALSNILGGLFSSALFLSGRWKKKKILDEFKIKKEAMEEQIEAY